MPGGQLIGEYGGPVAATGRQYLVADHLGSTRMVVSGGVCVNRFDYAPFGGEVNRAGEPCYGSSAEPRQKFTSKERDSETGLDYFGARYMSSAQGRFTSPDRPFADQHPEDPQSWNMYGYVRNNPLAHVDSTGEACRSLLGNTASGYCQRAELYANFDALVRDKTYFFAAASAASQQIANVAVPRLGTFGTSDQTRAFLASTNATLEKVNTEAVGKIISGQMSGPNLDARLVNREQTAVQKGLDSLQRSDPAAYGVAIKEINALLNSKAGFPANALAALGTALPSDRAYAQVLGGVRKALGRDIDFSNQKHREAIGLALVNYIRQTGGCDVTDEKAKGCGQ